MGSQTDFSEADLAALRHAKYELETPPLGMKLAAIVGAPVEKLIGKLPVVASDKVNDATQAALRKCLQIALKTLGKQGEGTLEIAGAAPPAGSNAIAKLDGKPGSKPAFRPSNLLHKFAVATTGAAGGAFGLFTLPVELPEVGS